MGGAIIRTVTVTKYKLAGIYYVYQYTYRDKLLIEVDTLQQSKNINELLKKLGHQVIENDSTRS